MHHKRSQWLGPAILFAALCLFFGWYAAIELRRFRIGLSAALSVYAALMLLFGFYIAPGFVGVRSWLATRVQGLRGAAICLALFLIPYLIYATGTGDFRPAALGKLAGWAVVPLGIFAIAPVLQRDQLNCQDVLALLWIVIPVLFGNLRGIWNVPVNLDFMTRVFLIAVGSWSFLVIRGVDHAGYEFRYDWLVLRDAVVSLAGFTMIAIPVGLAMRFIAWNPQWRGPRQFLFDGLTIFLFVAIAEELLFRGLLQNLLEGSFRSRPAAQAVASILFGLTHIRHAPYPNWRYVILATIAGWFYGSAYRKHRSLMASATTHALVDTLWRTWFTLPR
jgi:membrane protease YdiL (CAAX protease family)